MEVIYTSYAEDNLKERKISKEIIESSLKNPDEVVFGKYGRKITHKIAGNKLLRIIYEENGKSYIVVTAYYTKLKRYMKNGNKL